MYINSPVSACTVGKMKENGTGGSKKDAKREAAQKMIDKLKTLGQNRVEQVNTGHYYFFLSNGHLWDGILRVDLAFIFLTGREKVKILRRNLKSNFFGKQIVCPRLEEMC